MEAKSVGLRSAMAVIACTLFVLPLKAQVDFKGKTVAIIVNSKAGGGTDATARLMGNAMSQVLPGEPQIVIRNMPGGGGLKANNYFYSKVKPDGLTVLGGSRTQISPVKLLGDQAKYDPSKFKFIGGDVYMGVVFLVRTAMKDRLTDPKAQPLVYGDVDGTRSGIMISMWAKEYLGWNIRHVVGYSGSPAIILAARAGELQVFDNTSVFTITPLLHDGLYTPLYQSGIVGDDGVRRRRTSFPDVPLITDALLPKLDERGREAFDRMLSDMVVNKWMALPPDTPDDIVKVYRAAFLKANKDPDLLKVVHKEIGEDYTPMSGEQVQKIVDKLVKVTKDDLELINKMKAKNGLPVD